MLPYYSSNEIERAGIEDKFVLPDTIPRRLVPYFKKDQDIRVDKVRRYFRATGKTDEVSKKRLKKLRDLYRKRISEQFAHHKEQIKA